MNRIAEKKSNYAAEIVFDNHSFHVSRSAATGIGHTGIEESDAEFIEEPEIKYIVTHMHIEGHSNMEQLEVTSSPPKNHETEGEIGYDVEQQEATRYPCRERRSPDYYTPESSLFMNTYHVDHNTATGATQG